MTIRSSCSNSYFELCPEICIFYGFTISFRLSVKSEYSYEYSVRPIIGFSEYSADYSDFTDYRDHEYSVFTDNSKFYFFLKTLPILPIIRIFGKKPNIRPNIRFLPIIQNFNFFKKPNRFYRLYEYSLKNRIFGRIFGF